MFSPRKGDVRLLINMSHVKVSSSLELLDTCIEKSLKIKTNLHPWKHIQFAILKVSHSKTLRYKGTMLHDPGSVSRMPIMLEQEFFYIDHCDA